MIESIEVHNLFPPFVAILFYVEIFPNCILLVELYSYTEEDEFSANAKSFYDDYEKFGKTLFRMIQLFNVVNSN